LRRDRRLRDVERGGSQSWTFSMGARAQESRWERVWAPKRGKMAVGST